VARITSVQEAQEKFKSNDFFALKNDGDSAVVRFLYETEDQLDLYSVHEVKIGGKKRWVDCLGDSCPLCLSGSKVQLKLFLQLESYSTDGKMSVLTWERGQKFLPRIQKILAAYGTLCDRKYEIIRKGEPNDPDTDYKIYPLAKDGKRLAELSQKQELLGPTGFVLEKSVTEIQAIMDGTYRLPAATNDRSTVETPPRQQAPRDDEEVF